MVWQFWLFAFAALAFFIAIGEGLTGKKFTTIPWVAMGLLLFTLVYVVTYAPST